MCLEICKSGSWGIYLTSFLAAQLNGREMIYRILLKWQSADLPLHPSIPLQKKKQNKTCGRSICVTPILVHPRLLNMVYQVEKLQKGKRHLTPVRMAIIKKIYKQQMLERMWRKENPLALLVGM